MGKKYIISLSVDDDDIERMMFAQMYFKIKTRSELVRVAVNEMIKSALNERSKDAGYKN